MTYRKKRLLLIQGALLFAALLLFYIFYYERNKTQVAIETDSVVLEKTTNIMNIYLKYFINN